MKRLLLAVAMLCALPIAAMANSCGAPAPILNMVQMISFSPDMDADITAFKDGLKAQSAELVPINPADMSVDERTAFYAEVEAQTALTIAQMRTLAAKAAASDDTAAQALLTIASNLEGCTAEKRTALLTMLGDEATQPRVLQLLNEVGMSESFATECGFAITTTGFIPEDHGTTAFYTQCAKVALQHAPRDDAGHFTVMHRVAQPLCQALGDKLPRAQYASLE